jgi:hypothetical protein
MNSRNMHDTRRILAGLPALLALACAALFHGGCEGTSSGVDNPSLTVGFRDDAGTAARVTGDLNVYAHDQNPAVDPQPLWTVQVRNSALASLTGEDFERIAAASKVAAKLSASASPATGSAAAADTAIRFNLTFKGQTLIGAVAFGLAYDRGRKTFSDGEGGNIEGLDLHPKALVRYQARLSRTNLQIDGVNRVYIPGTNFSATLTDSGFTFEDLPEGEFPLRLLAQDGRILAVRESLDTRVTREFTCNPVPVDTISPLPVPVPDFSVEAGPRREVSPETAPFAEARVAGVDPKDPRLHFLWRFLPDSSSQKAVIKDPASPVTTLQLLSGEGIYHFEIAVTLGTKTAYDTLELVATRPPAIIHPRIIRPFADEVVPAGKPYQIQWLLPSKGPVSVEIRTWPDGPWTVIVPQYLSPDSLPVYTWTPDLALRNDTLLIQVRSLHDTGLAVSEKPFFVR